MSYPAIDFDQIIAPLTRERFLAEYWTKKFLHLAGPKGRFTPILPWEELSHILEWHPPPQPQLRMFQEGVMVDLRRYIDGPVGSLKLNAGGLIALLGQGATMVLDSLHEVSPAVAHLTESIEATFSCACVANLYAGWRTQKGFNVHWDAQDIFVLQLSGRKRWQVFAPTRAYPLGDDSETAQPPTAPPIWEGILNDGELLYLPRGFWHVAYPLDEPSLHVSWSAQPSTGVEFLTWWMRTLRRHPEARISLTQMEDPGTRKQFVRADDRAHRGIRRPAIRWDNSWAARRPAGATGRAFACPWPPTNSTSRWPAFRPASVWHRRIYSMSRRSQASRWRNSSPRAPIGSYSLNSFRLSSACRAMKACRSGPRRHASRSAAGWHAGGRD